MGKGHQMKRKMINLQKPYIQYRKGHCERCGSREESQWKIAGDYRFKSPRNKQAQLTAHHIDGNPENNSPENIQTLCRKCHDEFDMQGRNYQQ